MIVECEVRFVGFSADMDWRYKGREFTELLQLASAVVRDYLHKHDLILSPTKGRVLQVALAEQGEGPFEPGHLATPR